MEVDLTEVIELLQRELRAIAVSPTNTDSHGEVARRKRQLVHAIGCLRLCQEHEINPRSRVIRLPNPVNMTPSSEFRLIEDQESDRRENWIEVESDGEPIRPVPGSLLLEPTKS
jgi:hypothetical protein